MTLPPGERRILGLPEDYAPSSVALGLNRLLRSEESARRLESRDLVVASILYNLERRGLLDTPRGYDVVARLPLRSLYRVATLLGPRGR